MRRRYDTTKHFQGSSMAIIQEAQDIVSDYAAQGFALTLRQLFYQFVSRGLLPNDQRQYKRLGGVINDARMQGLLDWSAIEDRTRFLRENSHWTSPEQILRSAASSYAVDHWTGQDVRVEVWIEKDALTGVLDAVCPDLDIPYFSCRGYVSSSEMWRAGQRIYERSRRNLQTVILHLGDHDPSGIQMTEDIEARLLNFYEWDIAYDGGTERSEILMPEIRRIALTMDQVQQYNPPPNPAKLSDSRARDYVARYGSDSWELDALEPNVLVQLIRDEVEPYIDRAIMQHVWDQEDDERQQLTDLVNRLGE